MRPSNPTLKFSDKEFEAEQAEDMVQGSITSKTKAAAFVQLFGSSKWNKLKSQFAKQRIPDELPFSESEIKNMSDAAWEKHQDEIMQSQSLPKKSEPVFGEVEAPDLSIKGFEGQQMFIKNFGYERYFRAMGVNVNLDSKAYHEALGRKYEPYVTRVSYNAKTGTSAD